MRDPNRIKPFLDEIEREYGIKCLTGDSDNLLAIG